MRACVCPTKPFTEACSFKPVERAEKGAAGAFAIQAPHTPVSALSVSLKTGAVKSPEALSIRERPAGSGGSCHSGSLGGRSPARLREQSHRDLGGTPFALRHADQGTQQKYGGGCGGH